MAFNYYNYKLFIKPLQKIVDEASMKKTIKTPTASPHSDSRHPHAHMHQHLLPCNKLHDYRHTHTYRVSSITKGTNTTWHN